MKLYRVNTQDGPGYVARMKTIDGKPIEVFFEEQPDIIDVEYTEEVISDEQNETDL